MSRPARSQLLVAVLAAILGFGLVVQVRSRQGPSALTTARQEDLVRILDDLDSRSERLRAEIADLERTRDRLRGGAGQERAALEESRRRTQILGILAGTLPATGPGVVLTVTDPERTVDAATLLDALQELRDAGAEAVQLNDVRLALSSHFVDRDGRVFVDGTPLTPPYRFIAIGDANTLAEAMGIPGGVLDVVASRAGAQAYVDRRESVTVSALRPLSTPRYARPAPSPGGS